MTDHDLAALGRPVPDPAAVPDPATAAAASRAAAPHPAASGAGSGAAGSGAASGAAGSCPVVPDPVVPDPEAGSHDPAVMREQYRSTPLLETDLAADPMDQFARWFKDATSGGLHEPNAVIVSTATPDGRPSSRTVLLKQYDARGFVFYTNYDSRKGREIAANPYVSLLFPWHPLARQVIVTGVAARIGRDETAAYFRSRPHGSQLGAWASEQSSVIGSRDELLRRYEELATRYPEGEQVPAPPEWGGYRIDPQTVEFWQGHENRLHDRLRYVRTEPGWRVERLSP